MDQAYKTSKGTFSIQRYGQLKDMIKEATSESTLQSLQQVLHDGAGEAAGTKLTLYLQWVSIE